MKEQITITEEKFIDDLYPQYMSPDYPVSVYYVDFSQMFMNTSLHHWHEEMEIDFVKSGSATFEIGEEILTVSEGSAVIINGNRIHTVHPTGNDNCVILSILFNPGYIFDSNNSFLATKYRTPIINNMDFPYFIFDNSNHAHRPGIECINLILNDNLNKSYGYELITKSNLCRLWVWMLGINDKNSQHQYALSVMDEERVKQAFLYIHENYGNNISLDELAENIHLSKSECCRCFKRASNLTPFEYIMRHRIYAAALKMQRGEKSADSINELSDSSGFNNTSYFNKVFKKYTGVTPTKYREQIKKGHRDALNPYGIPLSRI